MKAFRKLGTAAAAALALCACSSFIPKKEKPEEENLYPKDYKAMILDRLRAQLTDPKGIRAALLAEPVLKPRVPLRVISPASASIQRFEGRAGPVPREQGVRGLLLCRRTNPDCRCGARCVRQVGLPAVSGAGEALIRRPVPRFSFQMIELV